MDDRGGRESGCGMCYLTDHAVQRTKERVGLPKRSAEKNAQKALENGIRHCETKGSLNRYITALYWKQKTANNIRIYCNNVYIFNNDVLITVFPLPQKYRNTAQKIKRKETRDDT